MAALRTIKSLKVLYETDHFYQTGIRKHSKRNYEVLRRHAPYCEQIIILEA